MTAHAVDPAKDPIRPGPTEDVTILVDGTPVTGVRGQTIAGVLLSAGYMSWRHAVRGDRPRGLFCGIGVCFDCAAMVNGLSDVRVCQRRAVDGDVVTFHPDLPESSFDELASDAP